LVLDRNLQLVPNGVFGELCIGGESLARGYLHRPELTASRFIADPYTPGERLYRTGDRVRWRSRGVLEFSRRLDRQVKLRGNRIELGEIETALEAQAGVERSLVVVREDRPGDERLVAYVVGRDLSSNELREQLVRTLPRTAIPSAICVLDAFPLTPNSKLDLNALPKPTDYVAHSTPDAPEAMDAVQHWLAGEWRQLLNVYRVRLDDDFFELGGHSLLALTLLTRIANRYGVRLTLATLFAAPTVRAQAKLLSDDFKVQRKRAVVPIQSVGTRPVLFFCSGWAGPILSLRALAEVLGDDQPLYLLDYFTDSQPDGITVAMIAAKLIDEMKLLQATGPYHLAGYSLGAKIVYEMARQLCERGESVPVLVLLDSYAPGHPILPPFAIRTLLHVRQALRLGPLRMWPYLLKYTVRLRRFVVDIEPAMYEGQLDEATTQFVAGLQRSAMALRRAAMQYEVSSYPGRVMLIRAADMSDWGIGANDPDPTGGWRDYAGSAECIGSLPSTHSHMLEVKHAVELGALLKISLDSAESARPVAEAGQHRASRPGVEKRP
jgi:thioesterase domain-containing protein/aryl carrier-like protein